MVVLNIKELIEVYKKEKKKVDKYSNDKIQEEYTNITTSESFTNINYQKLFDFIYNFYIKYVEDDIDVKKIVEKILKKNKLKLDIYNKTNGKNEDYIKFYKYKPIKSIGAGAYGQVYLVKKNKKTFACKVQTITPYILDNIYENHINNWLYEYKLGSKVGKEKIGPKMYDIHFIYDKQLNKLFNIIIMEHINGPTLYNYTLNNTLNTSQVKLLETTIDKLHKMGIAHGDLHLNNIMVVIDKKKIRFCIIDYGYAKDKKKLINNQFNQNKQIMKYINNNNFDPKVLITVTHLIDNNIIEVIQ